MDNLEPKPPQNCWEIFKCGREEGGNKVAELGVCPAATDTTVNGLNKGKNGGRICWIIAGTFCRGDIQGSFADKTFTCFTCPVFIKIQKEEGKNFVLRKPE